MTGTLDLGSVGGARRGCRLVAMILAAASMAFLAAPVRAGWVTLPNAPIAPAGYGRHDDLFFASPDSGWVVNGAGEIHRTTDGGQSWTLQTTVSNYLRCVGFATSVERMGGRALRLPPALRHRQRGGHLDAGHQHSRSAALGDLRLVRGQRVRRLRMRTLRRSARDPDQDHRWRRHVDLPRHGAVRNQPDRRPLFRRVERARSGWHRPVSASATPSSSPPATAV